MYKSIINNRRGAALLYVVLVVFVVTVMIGVIISLLTYEVRINKITEERLKAKYFAEAGIEHAMLETSEKENVIVYDDDGNALYQYSLSISGGAIDIESYGYFNNAKRVKIDCKIKNDTITKWEEKQLK